MIGMAAVMVRLVGDESRQAAALAVLDVARGRAADDPGVLRSAALAAS